MSRKRRTYFNHPLVGESLQFLPEAVDHTTTAGFSEHVAPLMPFNSVNTRRRNAQYIAHRYSAGGSMNLDLARALRRFGAGRVGHEILYFEMLCAEPVLLDTAAQWLAEVPPDGATREQLVRFLEPRLAGRSVETIAKRAVTAFRYCGKLSSPRLAVYVPVWTDPPLETFLYALARLFPEETVVPVETLVASPVVRSMLWRRPALDELLQAAWRQGHLSKVSRLDQLYQFSLEGSGAQRLAKLVEGPAEGVREGDPDPPARAAGKRRRPASKPGDLL